MITDPIGDMLIRIKNGYRARKQVVKVPYSSQKETIAKVLVKEGYLEKSQVASQKSKVKTLELTLKYEGKKPALEGVRRVSKPGVRIYARKDKIPKVKFGLGITIVSTPKGIMTGKEAQKKNLGGEVICQVW